MPASKLGKYKTVGQQLAVAFALLPWTALDATWLWNGLLWIAVVLALISGGQYLCRARQLHVRSRAGNGVDLTSVTDCDHVAAL